MKSGTYIVGIDIGGTFTDAVLVDIEAGTIATGKVPSTPGSLEQGVFSALEHVVSDLGRDSAAVLGGTVRFVHGTTQTTNAVLTRAGSRVAMVATRGFGDQILIMRSKGRVAGLGIRERQHYRATDKPEPIVPPTRICEVGERVDYAGRVVVSLDQEDWQAQLEEVLEREDVEALAVALLWSHANPEHEARLVHFVRDAYPDVYAVASSEVSGRLGEYERAATAVVDAYVGPTYLRYVGKLQAELSSRGLRAPLEILHCSGGVGRADQTQPVLTIESGPAAGAAASALLAKTLGFPNVIATDVGGTTSKVCLITEGRYGYSREPVVGQYSLVIPMVDVVSIGAGGGSIAWVDGNRLRIGPRSAAAMPGPASYGCGGTEPTVTDADVILGFIDPDYFLGGRLALHRGHAEESMMGLADALFGGDVLSAAAAVKQVADAQMADMIHRCSVERGHDARDFVLFAYGGAGPLHVGGYAAELGARLVVVPALASVLSAYGAATSDARRIVEVTEIHPAAGSVRRLAEIYAELEQRALDLLASDVESDHRVLIERWVEARYRRQRHEVRVQAPEGPVTSAWVEDVVERFEREYVRLYGEAAAYREADIELVTFRVEAIAATPTLPLQRRRLRRRSPKPTAERPVFWPDAAELLDTAIYRAEGLAPGDVIGGPSLIEHPNTTIAVHRGDSATIDQFENTVITLKQVPG